jgi:alkylation response protein AidB-like acyl-CoA dehydrogenase
MRFALTAEQHDFAGSLDRLLAAADVPRAARAWADGDHAPGLALWERLVEQGLGALALEATPVEVCVGFEALGRHGVPGPWVESAAYLPVLLGRELEGAGSVAVLPLVPRALDADVAPTLLVVDGDLVRTATPGAPYASVDPARRLYDAVPGDPVTVAGSPSEAFDLAVLAASAQLLGLGEGLLDASVAHVKQRRQFGREIGSYQAVKHRLVDVRIGLDFARPLLYGAALGEVPASAAKVACGDAAYAAARGALQVHGAIGYTRELDLGRRILAVRALVGAWGTPAHHRAALLEHLSTQAGAR